jgi:hypothetical protein
VKSLRAPLASSFGVLYSMHRLPRLLMINRYMHLETLRYILFSKKKTSPLIIFVIQRLNKKKSKSVWLSQSNGSYTWTCHNFCFSDLGSSFERPIVSNTVYISSSPESKSRTGLGYVPNSLPLRCSGLLLLMTVPALLQEAH